MNLKEYFNKIDEKYILFDVEINSKDNRFIKNLKKYTEWNLLNQKKNLEHGDVLLNRFEDKILIGIALYNNKVFDEQDILEKIDKILNTLSFTLENKQIAAIKIKALLHSDKILGINYKKIEDVFIKNNLNIKVYEY